MDGRADEDSVEVIDSVSVLLCFVSPVCGDPDTHGPNAAADCTIATSKARLLASSSFVRVR